MLSLEMIAVVNVWRLLFQCQHSGHLLQGGLVLDNKKPQAVGESPVPDIWQARVLQPFQAVAAQVKEIFSGGLLETTLLLQFIWFTNALAYYGLVLLTTSVSDRKMTTATRDIAAHVAVRGLGYMRVSVVVILGAAVLLNVRS